jgi:hypothetical protein
LNHPIRAGEISKRLRLVIEGNRFFEFAGRVEDPNLATPHRRAPLRILDRHLALGEVRLHAWRLERLPSATVRANQNDRNVGVGHFAALKSEIEHLSNPDPSRLDADSGFMIFVKQHVAQIALVHSLAAFHAVVKVASLLL